MTIEEAIQTALEYEHKVRDHFRESAEKSSDPRAKTFFEVMTREEQGHVDYLEAKLVQWQETGKIVPEELSTVTANREWLEKGAEKLEASDQPQGHPTVREYLYTALQMEHEVTEFYRKLVETVDHPEAETLFRHFLEIEDGHTALVQAEIDFETKTGHFFDFREFTLDD